MLFRSSLNEVLEIEANGHVFAGDPVTFAATEPRGGLDSDGHMNVTLDITVSASTISDESGAIVNQYAAEQITAAVLLAYGESGWQVVDVASEPR